jgi:hypothetical protein
MPVFAESFTHKAYSIAQLFLISTHMCELLGADKKPPF